MDNQKKVFLASVALAIVVIFLTKPKGFGFKLPSFMKSKDKYDEPEVSNSEKSLLRENAAVAMQAMKNAIVAKETKTRLDKLNLSIQEKYGLKIMANKTTGKLRALSVKTGSVIAEEA